MEPEQPQQGREQLEPDPRQQSAVAPVLPRKRLRARQSCSRCHKHKLKCSGEVPCERCIRRKEEDSCELWHRSTGRPKTLTVMKANAPKPVKGCAYYSHMLQTIALNHAHLDIPVPPQLLWFARLWVTVAVHQDGVDQQFAIEDISRRTMIPITLIVPFEEGSAQETPKYAFAAVKLLSLGGGAPVRIRSKPEEWLQHISPTVPTVTEAAIDWLCIYEVVTTIRGKSQYTELRDSTVRVFDECTDATLLSFDVAPLTKDNAEWYALRTEYLDSFRFLHPVITDEDAFLQRLLEGFRDQLYHPNHEVGIQRIEFSEQVVFRDKQGRMWNGIWEERYCVAESGNFCYAARKIHSWIPRCHRAMQIVAHFSGLGERATVAGLAVAQSLKETTRSCEEAAPSDVSCDQKSELQDVLYDFGDLFESDVGASEDLLQLLACSEQEVHDVKQCSIQRYRYKGGGGAGGGGAR